MIRMTYVIGGTMALISSPVFASCQKPDASPNSWGYVTASSYADCLKRERATAMSDPLASIRRRNDSDVFSTAIVKAGTDYLALNHIPELQELIVDLSRSDDYTSEIQSGLQARLTAYRLQSESASSATSFSLKDAESLRAAWLELDSYLTAAQAASSVGSEKELIGRLRAKGAAISDIEPFRYLKNKSDLSDSELREFFTTEIARNNDELVGKLEGFLEKMVQAAQDTDSKARLSRQKAAEISEYAALAQNLVKLAAASDVLSPEDARRAVLVTDGVSQLAMAATGAASMSAAGPYAMALGGMLSLASAFSSQGPSESDQIFGMLVQISEQIADLQATVEQGFLDVQNQIGQTEIRIMGRLSEVLRQGDLTRADLNSLRLNLADLEKEILTGKRAEQVAALQEQWIRVGYDDERCLRRFSRFQSGRSACLAVYEDLVRNFTISENAKFTGGLLPDSLTTVPFEDRLFHIPAALRRLGIDPPTVAPIHSPSLEELASRVRAFMALNSRLHRNSRASSLFNRVQELEQQDSQFGEHLGSDATYRALLSAYQSEFRTIANSLRTKMTIFERDREISVTDSIVNYERNILNESQSYRGIQSQFPSSSGALYAQIQQVPDASALLTDEDRDTLRPHDTISNKLDNFARIASRKESTPELLAGDDSYGYTWIRPCNLQSGEAAFPVSRSVITNLIGSRVARLTLTTMNAVTICYTPKISNVSRNNSGIGNTTNGMPTVHNRFASLGMANPSAHSRFSYCTEAKSYFRRVYTKFPEFTRSDWEKCHKGGSNLHLHHKLFIGARKIENVRFTITFNLAGYRSPIKSFSRMEQLPNRKFDRCYRPYNHQGRSSSLSAFMPFRHQFPLPITQACPSIDLLFLSMKSSLREEIEEFFSDGLTTSDRKPELELSYGEAADAIFTQSVSSLRERLSTELFGDRAQFDRLNQLADLLRISSAYRNDSIGGVGVLSGQDIENYLALSWLRNEAEAWEAIDTFLLRALEAIEINEQT
jgi:hypothetical protein